MTKPSLLNENIPISTTEKTKRNRELYVTNLPSNISIDEIKGLLNTAMISIEAHVESGLPIVKAIPVENNPNFTLLEFRCEEECQNALKLNGMQFLDKQIKLGKPIYTDEIKKDEAKEMFPTLSSFEKDLNYKNFITNSSSNNSGSIYSNINAIRASSNFSNLNTPATSKLLASNIPLNFNEENIKEFFKMFGTIKSIELYKDPSTRKFNGQCCIEFETEQATQKALHYAIGIKFEDKILYIKRIINQTPIPEPNQSGMSINDSSSMMNNNQGMKSEEMGQNSNAASSLGILTHSMNNHLMNNNIYQNSSNYSNMISSNNLSSSITEDYIKFRENNPSNVICIKNWATIKELKNNKKYDDFCHDVFEECKYYGKVIKVKIPRPNGDYGVTGIGKVFVEFANRDGASWAKKHLNGNIFNGRVIEVVFHPEESFRRNQLD